MMMMSNKLKKIGIAFFLIVTSLSVTTITKAEEKDDDGFSFEVLRPDNQKDPKITYFDLLMKPNQKQTIQIQLTNASDKEKKISLKLNGAKTNSSGVIEYGPSRIKEDASAKYKFTDIVKSPKEVTLKPNSSEKVDITISMPSDPIEGYISGGLQLQDITDEGKKRASNQGMVINKFAYLVGILLSESETIDIKPDLKLNKVQAGLQNYSNSILVNFSNVTPVYVEKMAVDVKIMKKNSEKVLYESKNSSMRMAPNTYIDYPVSLKGQKMKPGNYMAKILVTAENGGHWSFEEPFNISREEAEKYNEQDLSLEDSGGFKWLWLIVGLLVLLFLIPLGYFSIKALNKKKATDNKKDKFKKKTSKNYHKKNY